MRVQIKRLICVVLIIGITAFLIIRLSSITELKQSKEKYADFFSQEEDFDVLFLGTSHVINDIFPMEIYQDYGIVSYNLGGHANEIATSYWILRNALEYTTPKVVVIDCMGVSSNTKTYSNFSFLHQSLDAFPLTPTKFKAVYDLLDDEVMDEMIDSDSVPEKGHEPRTKIGLLFDYSVYHSRWNSLSKEDFIPINNNEKGAESRINIAYLTNEPIEDVTPMAEGCVGEHYLKLILDLCKEKNIDILFTYLPYPNENKAVEEADFISDLSQSLGVNYINYINTDKIDYYMDFFDCGHLNPSGARKISSDLGNYLAEHYSLPDRRGSNYGTWDEDLKQYLLIKNEYLNRQEDVLNCLMLLYDNIDFEINLNNADLLADERVLAALNNIGIDVTQLCKECNCIERENGDVIYYGKPSDDRCVDITTYREGEHQICYEYYMDADNHVVTTRQSFPEQ